MNIKYLAKKILTDIESNAFTADQLSKACISVLHRNNLQSLLPSLIAELELQYKYSYSHTDTIVVADTITDELLAAIRTKHALAADAVCVVDPAIIGGYQIITADKKIDASIHEQLQQLQHHLLQQS